PAVPVCSSIWSTMVAFSWREDWNGDVGASVRAASGARLSVLDDTDAQPNTNTPEYHADLQTSDLYWTGGSRCVRLSLRLPAGAAVSNLRAEFLNTSGTAAGPGTGPPGTPPPGTPTSPPLGTASTAATTNGPHVVNP